MREARGAVFVFQRHQGHSRHVEKRGIENFITIWQQYFVITGFWCLVKTPIHSHSRRININKIFKTSKNKKN